MKVRSLGHVYVVAMILGGWLLMGQPVQAQDSTPPPAGERKPDREGLKALREKIEKMKHEKLKKALALDDESAKKFFELYHPAEKDIQDLVKQRNQESKQLQLMIDGAKKDEDVDPEVAKIRDLNRQIEARQMKLDEDLKPVLSPRQRAKLLVFEHEFNRRVHDALAKHKQEFRKDHKERRQMRENMRKMRRFRRMTREPNGP